MLEIDNTRKIVCLRPNVTLITSLPFGKRLTLEILSTCILLCTRLRDVGASGRKPVCMKSVYLHLKSDKL